MFRSSLNIFLGEGGDCWICSLKVVCGTPFRSCLLEGKNSAKRLNRELKLQRVFLLLSKVKGNYPPEMEWADPEGG